MQCNVATTVVLVVLHEAIKASNDRRQGMPVDRLVMHLRSCATFPTLTPLLGGGPGGGQHGLVGRDT